MRIFAIRKKQLKITVMKETDEIADREKKRNSH